MNKKIKGLALILVILGMTADCRAVGIASFFAAIGRWFTPKPTVASTAAPRKAVINSDKDLLKAINEYLSAPIRSGNVLYDVELYMLATDIERKISELRETESFPTLIALVKNKKSTIVKSLQKKAIEEIETTATIAPKNVADNTTNKKEERLFKEAFDNYCKKLSTPPLLLFGLRFEAGDNDECRRKFRDDRKKFIGTNFPKDYFSNIEKLVSAKHQETVGNKSNPFDYYLGHSYQEALGLFRRSTYDEKYRKPFYKKIHETMKIVENSWGSMAEGPQEKIQHICKSFEDLLKERITMSINQNTFENKFNELIKSMEHAKKMKISNASEAVAISNKMGKVTNLMPLKNQLKKDKKSFDIVEGMKKRIARTNKKISELEDTALTTDKATPETKVIELTKTYDMRKNILLKRFQNQFQVQKS